MTTILETERLRLRELTVDDAPFMFELITDPSWIEFIGDRGLKSVDDARRYVEEKYVSSYRKNGYGFWAVEPRTTGVPAGICGLIKREGLDDVDVGFAFLPRFAGNGYAAESAIAVVEYGRHMLGLRRIVAITLPRNHRSIRVLEKAGLRFERLIRMPSDPDELALYAIGQPSAPSIIG